jgi:hypothetical protein
MRRAFVFSLVVATVTLLGGAVPASPATAAVRIHEVATSTASQCWHYVPSPNPATGVPNILSGVDGASSNDLWAVGRDEGMFPNEALIEHWGGTSWTVSAQIFIGGGGTALNAVHAVASNDVWAVGYYNATFPLIEHWDGSGWFISATPVPGASHDLFGVAAASATDVWAVGNYKVTSSGPTQTLAFHWDGTSWIKANTPSPGALGNQLSAVDVVSSKDVWAVGSYTDATNNAFPLTEHWNGATWSVVSSPAVSGTVLTGVSAIAANDVWSVGWGSGAGFSIHWNGSSWTQFMMPIAGVEDYIHGVDALSSNDVWAVGEASPNYESWEALAIHWNGSKWSLVRPRSGPQEAHFFGVKELSSTNVWAVGTMVPGAGQTSTLTEETKSC